MKKFLSLFLSILLLLAVIPAFNVSAAKNPTFVVSTAKAKVGDKVEITVSTENNPGIISAQVGIEYDKNALKLVDVKEGKFKGLTYGPQTNIPFLVTWMDPLKPNNDTNGVFVTLEFEVLETAPNGKSEIALNYDPDNVFEYNTSAKDNFKNVDFDIQKGYVDIKNPDAPEQPVTSSQESKPAQNGTASQGGSSSVNSTAKQENVYEQMVEELLTSSNNAQSAGTDTNTATDNNVVSDGTATKTDGAINTENDINAEDSSDGADVDNADTQKGWLLWVVIAAVVLLGGAFAIVIINNKKK